MTADPGCYRIGSAVACLPSKQGSGVIYRSNRSKCIGGQLVFLVDSEFTRPKTSELLETKKDKKKKMEMLVPMFEVNFFGLFTRTDFSRLFP